MNPRLESLLRQRDLIQQHLRWLEGEIEQIRSLVPESGSTPIRTDVSRPPAEPAADREPSTHTESAPLPDVLDAPHEIDVRSVHNEVRRGCLIYASVAIAVLGAVIAFIYWRY